MKSGKISIEEILQNSDRAEVIEWLTEHIGDTEKCLIILGIPDGEGGLDLKARQMGFDYLYEIQGFSGWVADLLWDGDNVNLDDKS